MNVDDWLISADLALGEAIKTRDREAPDKVLRTLHQLRQAMSDAGRIDDARDVRMHYDLILAALRARCDSGVTKSLEAAKRFLSNSHRVQPLKNRILALI